MVDADEADEHTPAPVAEPKASGGADVAAGGSIRGNRRMHSSHGSGMESSILRFKNVNFVVEEKKEAKHILQDISGKIKWGRKFLLCLCWCCWWLVCALDCAECAVLFILTQPRCPHFADVLAVMGPSGAVRLLVPVMLFLPWRFASFPRTKSMPRLNFISPLHRARRF